MYTLKQSERYSSSVPCSFCRSRPHCWCDSPHHHKMHLSVPTLHVEFSPISVSRSCPKVLSGMDTVRVECNTPLLENTFLSKLAPESRQCPHAWNLTNRRLLFSPAASLISGRLCVWSKKDVEYISLRRIPYVMQHSRHHIRFSPSRSVERITIYTVLTRQ